MFIISGISWYDYNANCLSILWCWFKGDIYSILSDIDNIIGTVLQSLPFYTSTSNDENSWCSTFLPVFDIVRLLNSSYSNENEIIFHHCFIYTLYILLLWNLLSFVLWLNIWSILVNVQYALEKNVNFVFVVYSNLSTPNKLVNNPTQIFYAILIFFCFKKISSHEEHYISSWDCGLSFSLFSSVIFLIYIFYFIVIFTIYITIYTHTNMYI